jgi:SPP1 family predicted phage head-tail adaptor
MLPKVRIGEMRQRVTIQADAGAPDAYGDTPESWRDVAANPTVPAEVIATTGREAVNAQQTRAIVSWRVRMRYRPDVTPAHRFVFNGRVLTISWGGDPDGRRRELAFYCSESVALAEAEAS